MQFLLTSISVLEVLIIAAGLYLVYQFWLLLRQGENGVTRALFAFFVFFAIRELRALHFFINQIAGRDIDLFWSRSWLVFTLLGMTAAMAYFAIAAWRLRDEGTDDDEPPAAE